MAERARKNLKEINALQALSLDDLPEGGLDSLWSRLKTIMAERPDPSQAIGNGSDRRAEATATLQKAEQDAVQATDAAFDNMRSETKEELAGAQKIKAAAAQEHEEAEAALAQANELKTQARQQADEMLTEVSGRVDTMLAQAEDKDKTRIDEAEVQAQEIIAQAQSKADEVLAQAQMVADRDVEVLKVEAIEEIKMVRDGIARMQAELEEELETQRILTEAARLSMVSAAVTAGAGAFVEKAAAAHAASANGHQNSAITESDEEAPPLEDTPGVQGIPVAEGEKSKTPDEPKARKTS